MACVVVHLTADDIVARYLSPNDIANGETGVLYNLCTKSVTTTPWAPLDGSLVILDIMVADLAQLLDSPKKFDHYLSVVNDLTRVHNYQGTLVKVRLPTRPNGNVILISQAAEGRRTLTPKTTELPFDRIEDIKFIAVTKTKTGNTEEDHQTRMLQTMSMFSPDPDFYADGTPKDRIRYSAQISSKIPSSIIIQEAAADAYIATIPKPFSSANPLVALDPAMMAGYLLTVDRNVIPEAVEQCLGTMKEYFRVYADAEKTDTAITIQWWKKALKTAESLYRVVGSIAECKRAAGFGEYKDMRDCVSALRYHLGVMLRRSKKVPMEPSSAETDSPAWWVKESKEYNKQKVAKEEKDNSEVAPQAPKVNQERARLRRAWLKRRRQLQGGGQREQESDTLDPKKESEETQTKKKKFFVKGLKAHHTKATRDPKTGEWSFE